MKNPYRERIRLLLASGYPVSGTTFLGAEASAWDEGYLAAVPDRDELVRVIEGFCGLFYPGSVEIAGALYAHFWREDGDEPQTGG